MLNFGHARKRGEYNRAVKSLLGYLCIAAALALVGAAMTGSDDLQVLRALLLFGALFIAVVTLVIMAIELIQADRAEQTNRRLPPAA